MIFANKLTAAVLAAALGALIAPAFAQNGSSGMPSDHGITMGHMDHGMMGGMMSGNMMAGCTEMMQSMNNGANGKPNSQWQKHPPQSPDNGG